MEKLNLNAYDVYNKEFNIDVNGFSCNEVNSFLDLVIADYQIMEENIKKLQAEIENLNNLLTNKDEEILSLKSKSKFNDFTNTTQYSSIDLLKRVSRLEEEVFKKD